MHRGSRGSLARRALLVIVCMGSACAGDAPPGDDGHEDEGLPVGSACSADGDCAGPGAPQCVTGGLYPLAELAASESTVSQGLADIGFDLPGGYCSTVPPCSTDADCGEGGSCFAPLATVDAEDFGDLVGALALPAADEAVVMSFLDYGQCLQACESDTDCAREGYECVIPIGDFLALVSGADMRTFCIGEEVVPPDPCDPNPCQNGGTCNAIGESGHVCACTAGYEGTNCETEVSACADDPCVHATECTDTGPGTYACTCEAGWSGADCDTDIDECAPAPCRNGGTCTDGIDGYTCDCPLGFAGPTCESVVGGCTQDPCVNATGCTDTGPNAYECACIDGWTGTNCDVNVDDCTPNPCLNGGTCTDGVDSYRCSCVSGFAGTDCETAVTGCADDPCVNATGCTDTGPGTYTCTCAGGWTGSHCTVDAADVPDCAASPCLNGSCIDGAPGTGEYTCDCNPGYEGTLCDVITNLCNAGPCLNGGSCRMSGPEAYECTCVGSYWGPTCEEPPSSECVLTYDLVVGNGADDDTFTGSNMRIRATPLGLGNGTWAIGPGTLVLRVPSDGTDNPAAGVAEVLYYELVVSFTTTTSGTTIDTDVVAASPAAGQVTNDVALATGTLAAGSAPTIVWDACTYPAGYDDDNQSFTPDVVGTGPGCLAPYRSVGNVACNGSFCSTGGLNSGDNPQDETWEQAMSTLSFSADFTSVSMPFMLVPDRQPSRARTSWGGTLASRVCQ